MHNRLPIIAIVGRPNVGKSTLFNRLIGRRKAVTYGTPGTTRDRMYAKTKIDDYELLLVDTGGLSFESGEDLEDNIQKQVNMAIEEADAIYLVLDAATEMLRTDFEAVNLLRKSKKPVLLIANKSDKKSAEEFKFNLYELGLGEPIMVSSIHLHGMEDLHTRTTKLLKQLKFSPRKENEVDETAGIRISILGRPNVGKSSLVNALLGEERVIVSEKPGTTVDAVDTTLTFDGQIFTLIDTAGIRRRGKIEKGIEKISVIRAIDAVERCDIVVLLLDGIEGPVQQDCHISEFILEAGKGLILGVNKCDLLTDPKNDETALINLLRHKMDYIPWAPVIFLSALTKKNIFVLFDLAKTIFFERQKKIADEKFSYFLTSVTTKQTPPSKGAKVVRFYGGKQVSVNPPVFRLFTNFPDDIHFSYRRFLENEIRKTFGFNGTSIRVELSRKTDERRS